MSHHEPHWLLNAIRDAIGPSQCFLCGDEFATSYQLILHLKLKCPLYKVSCSKCEFYDTRTAVNRHYEHEHVQMECAVCKKMFKRSELRAHLSISS